MALGSLVGKASREATLKSLIKAHFTREEWVHPLKEDSELRVSRFSEMCPREEVLCSRLNLSRKDKVTADNNLTFLHGSALHWAMQNKLLVSIGVVLGVWRCLSCGKVHGGGDGSLFPLDKSMIRRPAKCGCANESDPPDFLFEERRFRDDTYKIGGHPDGFLVIPGFSGMGILEGKSINPNGAWQVKNVPSMNHTVQLQIYMWLTGLKWGKILYWDKAGQGLSSLIEHTVEYDEDTVAAVKKQILTLRRGLAGGPLPERFCESRECKRASRCEVAEACFAPGDSP